MQEQNLVNYLVKTIILLRVVYPYLKLKSPTHSIGRSVTTYANKWEKETQDWAFSEVKQTWRCNHKSSLCTRSQVWYMISEIHRRNKPNNKLRVLRAWKKPVMVTVQDATIVTALTLLRFLCKSFSSYIIYIVCHFLLLQQALLKPW